MSLRNDPKSEADVLFSMFDIDGDQHLSRVEFKEMLYLFWGSVPNAAFVDTLCKRLDPGILGVVSMPSYIDWLSSDSLTPQCQKKLNARASTSSAAEVLPAGIKPFEAYLASRASDHPKDTRPPWYSRHHIHNPVLPRQPLPIQLVSNLEKR